MFTSLQVLPFFTAPAMSHWWYSWWQWLLVTLRTQLGIYFYFCKTLFSSTKWCLKGLNENLCSQRQFVLYVCVYISHNKASFWNTYIHSHTRTHTYSKICDDTYTESCFQANLEWITGLCPSSRKHLGLYTITSLGNILQNRVTIDSCKSLLIR